MKKQDEIRSDTTTDELNEELQESQTLENNSKPKKSKIELVVFCVIALFIAGGYLYFQYGSGEVEPEALEVYKEASNENMVETYLDIFDYDEELLRKWGASDDLAGGNTPAGMTVVDYGEKGQGGVLKMTETVAGEYSDRYNVRFQTYYMTNLDMAAQRYSSIKNGFSVYGKPIVFDEVQIGDNIKVTLFTMETNGSTDIAIQKGTVVFHAVGKVEDNKNLQLWLDEYLKIDYTVPVDVEKYVEGTVPAEKLPGAVVNDVPND